MAMMATAAAAFRVNKLHFKLMSLEDHYIAENSTNIQKTCIWAEISSIKYPFAGRNRRIFCIGKDMIFSRNRAA